MRSTILGTSKTQKKGEEEFMLGTGMKALDKSMKRYRRCFRKLKKPMTKVSDRQMVEVEAQSEANSSDALPSLLAMIVTIKQVTLSIIVTIVAGFTLKHPEFDPLGVVYL
jgi:hypothetical protein